MTNGTGDTPEIIPVYTLVPPDALLIDIAGPLEVLRYANKQQTSVRFDCHYIAPQTSQATSIGLTVSGLEPLPDRLPPNAMLIVSGSIGVGQEEVERDPELITLCRWLGRTVAEDTRLVTICSGALLAGAAGLLEGHACTTPMPNVSTSSGRCRRRRGYSTTGSMSTMATGSPVPAFPPGST